MTDKEYAQKEDGWCGPSALSYALSKIGIDVSQEELVKDTGTTKKKGCDPIPLKKAAEKHGATVEIMNGEDAQKTLKELVGRIKNKEIAIVDYLVSGESDGGHYIVFLGMKGGQIQIWNPSGGKKDTMNKEYFIENWKDKEENGKQMKNWAMVLRA